MQAKVVLVGAVKSFESYAKKISRQLFSASLFRPLPVSTWNHLLFEEEKSSAEKRICNSDDENEIIHYSTLPVKSSSAWPKVD